MTSHPLQDALLGLLLAILLPWVGWELRRNLRTPR